MRPPRHRWRAGGALALALLGSAGPAQAFWGDQHSTMNGRVSVKSELWSGYKVGNQEVRKLDDYLKDVLFISQGLFAKARGVDQNVQTGPWTEQPDSPPSKDPRTLFWWNTQSAIWEDTFQTMDQAADHGGLRVANHFHDPVTNGGFIGMVNPHTGPLSAFYYGPGGFPGLKGLLGFGSSAAQWAQTGDSVTAVNGGKNAWCFDAARSEFKNFLGLAPWTAASPRGEVALANTFRALGQVEHLIEDNAVPDHSRDLGHPGYGFEEYVRDTKGVIPNDLSAWAAFRLPLQTVEQKGFRAIWDQDVYDGVHAPAATDLAGISEYSNANFFAYNHLTKFVAGPVKVADCEFTTIPERPDLPFVAPSFFPAPVTFPFPVLEEADGGLWSGSPATAPSPLATAQADYPENCMGTLNDWGWPHPPANGMNAEVWKGYAARLLPVALGYATTPLRLLFQPIEAHFEIDPGGDPTRLVLHLYNHGTGSDGVTWFIDKIVVAPVSNRFTVYADPSGITDERQLTIDTGSSATVGPGEEWVSPPFQPTMQDIWMLNHAPYVSVIIDAHLGQATTTPISFGAVIPSSFVDIAEQNVDISAPENGPASFDSVACNSQACGGQGGAVGTLWNPIKQTVTGTLNPILNAKDTLGNELSGDALEAVKVRSRLAGAALVVRDNNSPDFRNAYLLQKSTLSFAGNVPLVQQGTGALWVRDPNAPDAADPSAIPFTAQLDFTEFADAQHAYQAAQNLYLITWTQAGNQSISKLRVWLPIGVETAQSLAQRISSCATQAQSGLGLLTASGCSQSGGTCSSLTWSQEAAQTALVNLGGFSQVSTSSSDFLLASEVFGMGMWTCTTLCGQTCMGDTEMVVSRTTDTGAGACPGPGTPLPLTPGATFDRNWATDAEIISAVLQQQRPQRSMTW